MNRKGALTIAITTAVLAVIGGAAVYAQEQQDKYSLKSPSGIAFSDFKGYEDWAVISSAKTDVLKVIVGNPTIIKAFKSGTPGNGQAFPDGSKIAKLQWKPKKSTEAPFDVDVPDVFSQAFFMLALVALEILETDNSDTARALRDEFVNTELSEEGSPFATAREARNHLRARIIAAQRRALVRLRDTAEIGDDAFHRIEEHLDRVEVAAR